MRIIRNDNFYIFIFCANKYPFNTKNKFVSDYIIKKGLKFYAREKSIILENIKIVRNDNKKPFIKDMLFFSLSHSGNYYCLAVANCEIGVDIEREKKIINSDYISKRLFGERLDEQKFIIEWAKAEAKAKLYGTNVFNKISSLNNYYKYKFFDYKIVVCQKE